MNSLGINVIYTLGGTTVFGYSRPSVLPRIGETMIMRTLPFEVKDIVWHIDDDNILIEIKIMGK